MLKQVQHDVKGPAYLVMLEPCMHCTTCFGYAILRFQGLTFSFFRSPGNLAKSPPRARNFPPPHLAPPPHKRYGAASKRLSRFCAGLTRVYWP
jgi:hypothetical protein